MVVQKPYYTNGTEASLNCSTDGYPLPSIVWLRHQRPIANKSMLYFSSILASDAGVYQCTVENAIGLKQINVEVNVTCKSVVTSCTAHFILHKSCEQLFICTDTILRDTSIEFTKLSAVTIVNRTIDKFYTF